MYYFALYTDRKCFDRYLPDLPAWSEILLVPQSLTGFAYDLPLKLRALEGVCYLQAESPMKWADPQMEAEQPLREDKPLQFFAEGVRFSAMVRACRREDTILRKYALEPGSRVTIGADPTSSIYQKIPLLSTNHGDLVSQGNSAIFTDHSRNGSYVNGDRLQNGQRQLQMGDTVTMGLGLKIVFLGDWLGVNIGPVHEEKEEHPLAPRRSRRETIQRREVTVEGAVRLQLLPREEKGELEIPEENHVSALVNYHRAPRFVQVPDTTPVKIEGPLPSEDYKEMPIWMTVGPSVTMIFPMLLSTMMMGGQSLAAMTVMMGGTAAVSAFWGVYTSKYNRKEKEKNEKKRNRVYREYIQETEATLMSYSEQEHMRLEDEFIPVNQCLELPSSMTHRLWERTTNHDDFAVVRLGTGDTSLPNAIQIPENKLSLSEDAMKTEPGRLKRTYENIPNAPVTMDLREKAIVGVLGHQRNPWLMQSMVMQLAALHSYHDLRIAVLTDRRNRSQWDWARWLPHVFLNEERKVRMVVSEPDAVQEVLASLESVWSSRNDKIREEKKDEKKDKKASSPLPHYVIFCTNPAIMENSMVLRHILSRPLGFTVVMMAYNMERLPKECGDIIQASEAQGAIYNSRGEVRNVAFERVELPQLSRFSSQIAPIRVLEVAENSAIPTYVGFLDVYHVRSVEDLDVWRFWNENKAYEGIRATVGYGAGMRPFVLDISDKTQSHGPHGLVAGTTGSGKSVMLQTYILSLALNYHPNQVQFILIDYKGGGMAGPFLGMPHLAGVIDNLQGERNISRALQSIKGEIKRREEAFKSLGISHIDDYIRLAKADPSMSPLAHIVIIVDEFAELKREQPDFMHELVSAARVGRSVGLHLILATQKPSNSVDDEIWSNTRFRICLRVADRADSMDMLKRPDAADLRGMGRCYVQVGNDEIFEQVQTSYSGAEYAPTELSTEEIPQMLSPSGQPIRVKRKSRGDEEVIDQMKAVTMRIEQVTAERKVPRAKRLWLDELGTFYPLEKLPAMGSIFDEGGWTTRSLMPITVPYAMLDDTEGQRHQCVSLDFTTHRNHIIVGPAATGKTTLLQTIALSLALRYTPAQVNMYIMSLTSNTLETLKELPHVGDVVLKNKPEEVSRMLGLIVREDERRKKLLEQVATDSFEQYNNIAERDLDVEPLPALFVMVDRFAQLSEMLTDDQMTQLRRLIEEANSRGIYFIVTAMNLNWMEIQSQISESMKGVALRVGDRDAFREVLGGTGIIMEPEKANILPVPGRGMAYWNGVPGETQAAVYASADDQERSMAIRELAERMNAVWTGPRPVEILRMPEELRTADMNTIAGCSPSDYARGVLPIGVAKMLGMPAVIDFNAAPELLITGQPRTGKTTAMLAICDLMRMQGAEVHLFGKASALADFAAMHADDVTLHNPEDPEAFEYIQQTLIPESVGRYRQMKEVLAEGPEAANALSATFEPIVIAIDDAADFMQSIDPEACNFIAQTIVAVKQTAVWFLIGVSADELSLNEEEKLLKNAVSIPQGLVMGGQLEELMPWSAPTSMEFRQLALPAGEGMLMKNGRYEPVIIPKI